MHHTSCCSSFYIDLASLPEMQRLQGNNGLPGTLEKCCPGVSATAHASCSHGTLQSKGLVCELKHARDVCMFAFSLTTTPLLPVGRITPSAHGFFCAGQSGLPQLAGLCQTVHLVTDDDNYFPAAQVAADVHRADSLPLQVLLCLVSLIHCQPCLPSGASSGSRKRPQQPACHGACILCVVWLRLGQPGLLA